MYYLICFLLVCQELVFKYFILDAETVEYALVVDCSEGCCSIE